jgi:hypothetical protein
MNKYLINYQDKGRLHEFARKIQLNIYGKIKRRKNARELRQKLKALPYVCRSGFVKMESLKMNTASLKQSMT